MTKVTDMKLFATQELETTESISRLSAQRAAQNAINEFVKQNKRYESNWGAFAVYAWAAVALIATSVGSTTLLLSGSGEDVPSSMPVASIQTSDKVEALNTASVDNEPLTMSEHVQAYPGDVQESETQSSTNIAQNEQSNSGEPQVFGAVIGNSTDIETLIVRYSALQLQTPKLMENVDPLINFVSLDDTPQGELVAGPFKTKQSLESFCKGVSVRLSLDCVVTSYIGDRLLEN